MDDNNRNNEMIEKNGFGMPKNEVKEKNGFGMLKNGVDKKNGGNGKKKSWFVEASPVLLAVCLGVLGILVFAVIGLGVDNVRKDQEIARLTQETQEEEDNDGMKGVKEVDTEASYNGNLGEKVNYRVDVNGVTLDDWKLFYQDDEADYVIFGGYLPNATGLAKAAGLNQDEGDYAEFGVNSEASRNDLLARLKSTRSKDLWNGVLTQEMKDLGATAKGGVEVETWAKSWNAKGYDKLELSTYDFDDGAIGYRINGQDMVDLSNSEGYSDELYFPRVNDLPEVVSPYRGYWIASESMGLPYVMIATDEGGLAHNFYGVYDAEGVGVRPVIRVPKGYLRESGDSGVWEIE